MLENLPYKKKKNDLSKSNQNWIIKQLAFVNKNKFIENFFFFLIKVHDLNKQ